MPVRNDPIRYPDRISVGVETPRVAAQSSPTASRFHSRDFQNRYKTEGSTAAANQASVEYGTASMPPINQRTMANDWPKLAKLCKNRISAMQMLFSVMPAISSVNEDSRRLSDATAITRSNVNPAPNSDATQT